jgi:hypothetical protein
VLLVRPALWVSVVIVLVRLGDGMKAGFNATFGKLATQIRVSKVSTSVDHRSTGDYLAASH